MPINYKDYHPDWKTVIRPAILERAKGRCEFCGIENYTINHRGSKVILTIAHLDHNKKNNDYSNLRALCQGCHLSWDLERHIKNRKRNRIRKEFETQIPLFDSILESMIN